MGVGVLSALLCLALLAGACSAVSDRPEFPASEVEDQHKMLRDTRRSSNYCIDYFPESPRLDDNVIAWRAIMAHPEADRHFKELLASPGIHGQLYALSGIYFTDREYFNTVIGRYLERTDTITSGGVDLAMPTEVGDVAREIADGSIPMHLRDLKCRTIEEVVEEACKEFRTDCEGGHRRSCDLVEKMCGSK